MKHPHPCNYLPLVASLLLAFPAYAGEAGRFQFVNGTVSVLDAAGKSRPARKGETLNEGDTVVTAPGSSAQVRMSDGGFMAVRPDTRLKVDQYRYAGKEDGSEKGLVSLVKGGFRTITGAIGRTNKENYRISTPAATIGIRGTDHEPVHIPPPAPGEVPMGPPGTYDKVNVGKTFLQTPQGAADIGPNQVGYVAGLDSKPTLLPAMPDFYKATTQPGKQDDGKDGKDKKDNGQQGSGGDGKKGDGNGKSTNGANNGGEGGDGTVRTSSQDAQAAAPAGGATGAAPAPAATTPPPTAASNLTGTDSSGNTLNLTKQVTVTPSGEEIPLGESYSQRTQMLTSFAYNTGMYTEHRSSSYAGYVITDSQGRPVSMFDTDDKDGEYRYLVISGGTGGAHQAGHYASTGVTYGRWVGSTLAGVDYIGGLPVPFSGVVPLTGFDWVMGPDVSPGYLPMVLTGTATYAIDGYTSPRNQSGILGTLDVGNTNLSIDFTKQAATARVSVVVNGWTWNAQATDVRLHGDGSFGAYTSAVSDGHDQLSLSTTDGSTSYNSWTASGAWGSLRGSLFGSGLSGAGLTYSFGANNGESVGGAIAYYGATQSTAIPYRGVLTAWGQMPAVATMTVPSSLDARYDHYVDGGFMATSRVTTDPTTGAPLVFDGRLPVAVVNPCGMGSCDYVADLPASFSLNGGAVGVLSNAGKDPTTGISWGRWGMPAGGMTVTDRITGATHNVSLDPLAVHSLIFPTRTGAISLPLTGTASYTVVGHTNPTNNLGNIGTLSAATLNANFTNHTVDTSVALSIASQNWTASATAVPIQNGGFFMAQTGNGVAHLNVTCTGASCGSTNAGTVVGAFSGATGEGAGIAYSLNTKAAPINTTVSGVVAFKR